jgi:teichuronic acid biosynthesis glycosyltransferase TuaG
MHYEEKKKHINIESTPLVSIITPLYNASSFISETILSVQNQNYLNWELIIVDDASLDSSVKIAEEFANNDSRIFVYRNKQNKGAAFCRNLATEKAKGDFVAFLDADDLWHQDKLQKQLNLMQEKNNPVSCTSYLHIDEQGKLLNKRIKALPLLSYNKQHRNNYIGNLTGMYNASVLGKITAPNIRKRQDWAVWLEAIKRSGKPALGIQEDLAYYRIHKGGISSNKLNLIKYNYIFYRDYLGVFFWEYFIHRPKQIEKL